MLRTIFAIALVSSAWATHVAAGGTVCSSEPTACDGTYNGTTLCACPARRVPPTNAGRRRGSLPACRGWGRAAPGGGTEGGVT